MPGTSWSSSSSCTSSFGSLDDHVICVVKPPDAFGATAAAAAAAEGSVVKFLCSYGGRILPRHADGALRYVGGDNRVLSVDRSSLSFHELQQKMREMCGWAEGTEVSLRCQLPTEDLDALVSVTGDDDLANLLAEYNEAGKDDRRLQPLKIRAFLFPRTTPTPAAAAPLMTRISSLPSPSASRPHLRRLNTSPAARSTVSPTCALRWRAAAAVAPQLASRGPAAARPHLLQPQHYYDRQAGPCADARLHYRYLVHNGRHWQ